MGDDIFGYFDYTLTESVESMDSYLRRNSPKGHNVKRPDKGGALGIFEDDSTDPMDDDDDEYFGDDDRESAFTSENMDELVERLADIIAKRYGAPPMAAAPGRVYPNYTYPRAVPTATRGPMPAPSSVPVREEDRIGRLEQAIEANNRLLGQFIDVISRGNDGDGETYEEDLGEMMIRRAPGSDVSMEEALELANGASADESTSDSSSDLHHEDLPSQS